MCCSVQKPDWSSCLPQASTVLASLHMFVPCHCARRAVSRRSAECVCSAACWLVDVLFILLGGLDHVLAHMLTSWCMYARSIAASLSLWICHSSWCRSQGPLKLGEAGPRGQGRQRMNHWLAFVGCLLKGGEPVFNRYGIVLVSCAGILPDCSLSTSVHTAARVLIIFMASVLCVRRSGKLDAVASCAACRS